MNVSRRALLRRAGAAVAVAAAGPFRVDAAAATVVRGPAPVRLSHNESAYGASPDALAVIRQADTGTVSLYPDVEYEALRQKLAARHRIPAERLALGSGSADLLRTLAGAYLSPNRSLIVAHPTCEVISRWGLRAGAAIRRVPLTANRSHDLVAMRRSCDDSTGLVYLCNPNNPTGSLTRRTDIDAFLGALPASALLVVDEAYYDYVNAGEDHASFLDRPVDDERIVVVRSFSKAYGLAGLRVGYAVASPGVVERMAEAAGTPTISSTAALAAAAALDDSSHLRSVVNRVADDRQEFYNQANARMLRVIDSHANFVMLDTTRLAADIVNHFGRNGIALPAPFEPLGEHVRVTLGTASDMRTFWRVWDLMSMTHTL
jgi:histidinol-phosphate aminotransferase